MPSAKPSSPVPTCCRIEEVLPQVPSLRSILATQRPGGLPATGKIVRSYQEVLRAPLRSEPEQRVTEMNHPIQVIYTSGTTGDPKVWWPRPAAGPGRPDWLVRCLATPRKIGSTPACPLPTATHRW